MRPSLKGIFGTTIALSVLLGAMNITKIGDRAGEDASYSHLLSQEYHKVSEFLSHRNLEKEADFFHQKSLSIKEIYNPRPMMVRNISGVNRSEIHHMRRLLERAMVGYEMRHAPKYVAAMHAAFECHIKTAGLNQDIAAFCLRNFKRFKVTAEKAVEKSNIMIAQAPESASQIVPMSPIYDEETFVKKAEPPVTAKVTEKVIAKKEEAEKIFAKFTPIAPIRDLDHAPIEPDITQEKKAEFHPIAPIAPVDDIASAQAEKPDPSVPDMNITQEDAQQTAEKFVPVAPVDDVAIIEENIQEEISELLPDTEQTSLDEMIISQAHSDVSADQSIALQEESVFDQITEFTPEISSIDFTEEMQPKEGEESAHLPETIDKEDVVISEQKETEAKEILEPQELLEAPIISEDVSFLDKMMGYFPFSSSPEATGSISSDTEKQPEEKLQASLPKDDAPEDTVKATLEEGLEPLKEDVVASVEEENLLPEPVKKAKIEKPKKAQFSLLMENEEGIKSQSLTPLGPYGKTLSLKDIVGMSLENNPDRMIATAQYYSSQSGVTGARAMYYPQVDAVFSIGRETNNPFSEMEERFDHAGYNHANTANIRFKQLIFDGFVTSETVSERLKAAKASQLNYKKVSEEVAFSAVQIYMQLKQFQNIAIAAEENLEALRDVEKLVDVRISAGARNHTEKKYIEARVASAEQRLIDARAGLNNAQSALEFILGRQLDFTAIMPMIKEDERFSELEQVVLNAYKKNTESNILKAQEDRSTHLIEAAIGKFYPQLALVMEAGHIEDVGGNTGIVRNAVAKLELTLPIFDGWLRSSVVDQRKAELQEAKANSLRYKRQLKQDLKTAYNNRVGAMEEVKTAIQEIQSNKELDVLNRQRFKFGEGDMFITDLVETRERIFNSKVNKAQFENEIVTSHYRIQQILGEILPEFCDIDCEVN